MLVPFDLVTTVRRQAENCSQYLYRPQMKLRKGNVFKPVCQSFCSQGEVYTPHSLGKTPLWADTSLGKPPLPTPPRRSLQRTVRILLEYIIVIKHFNFEFILKRYPDVTNICQCIYIWKMSLQNCQQKGREPWMLQRTRTLHIYFS